MNKDQKLSKETIDHISKLALLDLSEEEKIKLSKELSNILNYFKKLDDLDTTNIKPLTHPIEYLKNVFREDIPGDSLSNKEALRNAKHKKDGYFKAPRILKE
ncbi:MAG: Asp-tRNA(Asn)/Glu-tRNA(Gln) amidotransferase subunit GatC [Candidatus Thorarchaeota archaeon]